MMAGHTKFSCDRCFGLIKKVTKRTFISSLVDIADCIDKSSESTNIAELIGLENGKQFIPYYDWKKFFENFFGKLPVIEIYHHFVFSKDFTSGEVQCKIWDDSEAVSHNILKKLPTKNDFPEKFRPKGLSHARKAYLAKEIRKFCKEESKDVVAPLRPVT